MGQGIITHSSTEESGKPVVLLALMRLFLHIDIFRLGPKHAFRQPAGARLTYGQVGRFVSFLVGAHSPAVEKGVQGFLLPAPRQAAEALGACPGVNAARLSLRQGAC